MSLQEYDRKRNFKKTAEPKGSKPSRKKSKNLIFVIQKHAARRLHYDFRLELEGALKSWAVPKGPSLDPQQKRLAVEVEDHPLPYAKFEGNIPAGQYGAGDVMIWDNGIWEPIGDPKKAYKKGHLEFILKGKKLQGVWHLVRLKKDEKGKTPWLLIKSHDEASRDSKKYDILEEQPDSVVSKSPKKIVASGKIIKKLPLIKPQLATLVDKAPVGDEWMHEVKYDGYRFLAYCEGSKIKFLTRNGKEWTEKFPSIIQALKKLNLNNTILDGELVAFDKKQQMSFQKLQNFLSLGETADLMFFIFDMPFYNGKDIRKIRLIERKALLKEILPKESDSISYAEGIIGNGQKVFEASCELKLEGIISKDSNSIYESRRTKTWLKIKCVHQEEFLIIGFTRSDKAARPIRSLLLGYYDDHGELQFSGHVGTGFTEASLEMLAKKLDKLKQATAPFDKLPEGVTKKITVWVRPKLVAQIKFTEITEEGILRHPVFLGLRSDKNSKEVRQKLVPENNSPISNPNKIMFKEKNITKGDLANYYSTVAPWILPYIINRPLMILRCPEGVNKECFFQKHYHEDDLPKGLYLKTIREKSGKNQYLYIKDEKGLTALSQLGVVEMHPWGSSNQSIEQPDRLVFDLDPGENVTWKVIIKAATSLRKKLLKYNLESFVKTSGKKGLHVVVPLKPKSDWEIIKEFCKQIAEEMVNDYPNEYVSTMTKSKRINKIFVDYFRNGRGSTSVAPYSCRANAEASVSLPLTWEELSKTKSADAYDIKATLRRVKAQKNPWPNFLKLKQTI